MRCSLSLGSSRSTQAHARRCRRSQRAPPLLRLSFRPPCPASARRRRPGRPALRPFDEARGIARRLWHWRSRTAGASRARLRALRFSLRWSRSSFDVESRVLSLYGRGLAGEMISMVRAVVDPGSRLLVRFGDRPGRDFERIAGWPIDDAGWIVATPKLLLGGRECST